MLGIIILTHGNLGQSFIDTLKCIHNDCSNIRSFTTENLDNIELEREKLLKLIDECDSKKGVLLLTDLFGGTASNLAFSTISLRNVAVLSGVNLPMLIKLSNIYRHSSLEEAIQIAQEYGRKYIRSSHEIMNIVSDESKKLTG